jgi:excisionase family DNA binding protein
VPQTDFTQSCPHCRRADPAPRLALTIAEVGQALGVDRGTVYRLLRSGELDVPVIHIGGSSRVRTVDLEAYLERLAAEVRQSQPAQIGLDRHPGDAS